MEQNDEQLVLFATSIAIQLAEGLSVCEIENLRNLINQISYTLGTIVGCKLNKEKCKKY